MELKYRKENNIIIISLNGDVDALHVKDINYSIENVIDDESRCDVIINLFNVDDISSSGLKMLITVMEILKKRDEYLVLTDLNRYVENILKRAQFYDVFIIMKTERDAMEFLTARRKPLM